MPRALTDERRDFAAVIDANPGELFARGASMAKLQHAVLEGVQMLGGYGYATECGMEALLRSTLMSTVYGGTSETQRDVLGRSYGL